jgi:hypothetical protein
MKKLLRPSTLPVRAIYCFALLVLCVYLFRTVRLDGLLMSGARGGFFVFSLFTGLLPSLVTLLLLALALSRLVGVASGKFTLATVAPTGPLSVLRWVGVLLMLFPLLPLLLSMVGILGIGGPGGSALVFFSSNIGASPTAGLLIFEASRMLERELLLEGKNAA